MNSNSSSFDSECHIIEYNRKNQISQSQLPKQMQTPSDLRPPTINSSFINCPSPFTDPVRSIQSYRESGLHNFEIGRKAKTMNANNDENSKPNDESQQIKKSLFNQIARSQRKQPVYTEFGWTDSQCRDYISKRYVKKFSQILFQKAHLYRNYLFNSYQKMLISEKYLEIDKNKEKDQLSEYNYHFKFYCLGFDIMMFLIIVMIGFWLPFKISFIQENSIELTVFLIIVIIMDIMINCFSPFILEGVVISDRQIIISSYLTNQLIWDIIFIVTTSIILTGNQYTILWIIMIFQVCSGFQKANKKLTILMDYYYFNYIQQLLIVIIILFIIHICSCLWYYIGQEVENSWLIRMEIENEDNFTLYCYSLYWSSFTLLNIGETNIVYFNNSELIFSSAMALISCGIIAFIITYFGNIYKDFFSQLEKSRKQNNLINQFLQHKQVSYQVSAKIRNFLNYVSKNNQEEYEIENIINKLSPNLKDELLLQLRMKALSQCYPLKKFSTITLEKLAQVIQHIQINQNQIIIQKNQLDDQSLYILDTGKLDILDEDKILGTIEKGGYFGEYSFFSGQLRSASVIAKQISWVYKIDQNQFKQIVSQNKNDHERYTYIRDSLQIGFFGILNMQCFSCKSNEHLVCKCPIWTYIPNLEKIYKSEYFHTQDRQQFLRNKIKIEEKQNKKQIKSENRVFEKYITNYDALKIFRLKYNYNDDDNEETDDDQYDDEDDDDEIQSYSEISDEYQSDEAIQEYNKFIDSKQDGTIVSILRQQDQIKETSKNLKDLEDDDQMFIFRPNTQKGTLSTAQFQYQNDIQQQQLQLLQQQNYRFSLVPQEIKNLQKRSISQENLSTQQIANETPIPSVKRIRNAAHITFKGETESIQKTRNSSSKKAASYVDKQKKLSKIREEDSDTLNLSNQPYTDDHISSPKRKKIARQSQNSSSQQRQSMKRFSSKLSSIPIKSGTITQQKSTVSPIMRSNIQLPTIGGMVDLSMYRRIDSQSEEFERMFSYTLYFPLNNYRIVIARLNFLIRQKFNHYLTSKYTFQNIVKHFICSLNKYVKIDQIPDE